MSEGLRDLHERLEDRAPTVGRYASSRITHVKEHGVRIGLTLPYQSLPTTPLRLTATEKRDLIAFSGR